MTCPQCGRGFDQGEKGRPRKYCSNACSAAARKRKQRARQHLDLTEAERKIRAVWSDPAKRERWSRVMTAHKDLIADVLTRFEMVHDMPVEMQGSPRRVLQAIAARAVAELVHDHSALELHEAMIVNRIGARLEDERRESAEFERARVEGGRETRRPSPTGAPQYQPDRDVTGARAVAALERRRRMHALPEPDRSVYFVYVMARQSAADLAGVFTGGLEAAGQRVEPDALFRSPDTWRAFSREAHPSALATVRAFVAGNALVPEEEIEPALRRALETMGEPELPELRDDGPEERGQGGEDFP